ncbi:serine incorporator 2 [Angomonas deanei]|nr:serine incorporator 2 [Angomonas deanei]|eukprot:EPY32215.1 serine incorporator 2 [Angomonas deanei]
MDSDGALEPGLLLRLSYGAYLFIGLLAMLIIQGALSTALAKVPFLSEGCSTLVGNEKCSAEMLTYRVSFALTLFFSLHWLSVSDLTCCIESKTRAQLQESFFTFKTVLLVLFFLLTLVLPNTFFAGYAYVCLFGSAVFLFMNVIFLVDFSYQWSDDWGERADENEKWFYYLLFITFGSFLLGAVVTVATFYFYVPSSDCTVHLTMIVLVLIATVVFTGLSIYIPHGSIVPSGIVFLYTISILYVTLQHSPMTQCVRSFHNNNNNNNNKIFPDLSSSTFEFVVSTLLSPFALLYAVVSSSGNSAALNIGVHVNEDGETVDDDDDRTGHLSKFMFFYFVMILGSMYLAMLASGWHISGLGDGALATSVSIAFWVRLMTVTASIILYLWSLLAPYTCCRGRDYGFEIDEDLFDFDL